MKQLVVALFISLFLVSCAHTGTSEHDLIPVDENLQQGRFDNGMAWYYLPNPQPANRLAIRLYVHAGSILEQDDQRGLAHFVEHMAFNGTRNFAKQDIVNYFESIGMQFGPELNAYTSFDETVYMIDIPSDSPEILAQSFQILQDWAFGIQFDPEEVEKERGVIEEEWRLGQGVRQRIQDQQIPLIFQNSQYAERLPIGIMEVVRNAPAQRLKDFYAKWYRPELMSIVVVGDSGDFDVHSYLSEYFDIPRDSDLIQNTPENIIRPFFAGPKNQGQRELFYSDSELKNDEILIYNSFIEKPSDSKRARLNEIADSIALRVLNNQFEELLYSSEPPFLYAGAGLDTSLVGTINPYLYISSAVGQSETAYAAAYEIVMKAQKIGFPQSEIDQVINEFDQYLQQVLEEDSDSGTLATQIISSIKNETRFNSKEYYYELFLAVKSEMTSERCRRIIEKYFSNNDNRYFQLTGPAINETIDNFDAIDGRLEALQFQASTDEEELPTLIKREISQLDLKSIEELDGVSKAVLSNGATIYVKTTDFDSDSVYFSAYTEKGQNDIDINSLYSFLISTALVYDSGFAGISAQTLDKVLSSSSAELGLYAGDSYSGMSGFARPEDLEDLFQQINGYMTAPNFSQEVYESIITRLTELYKYESNNPESVYVKRFYEIIANGDVRQHMFSIENIDSINLLQSKDAYEYVFSNPGDFVYVFVGNVTVDQVVDLASKYLVQQNNTSISYNSEYEPSSPPKGIISQQIFKGTADKARVSIYFHGTMNNTLEDRYFLQAGNNVLNILLREKIREDLSGVYNISVSENLGPADPEKYSIIIQFGCDPDRVTELTSAVKEVIANVINDGIERTYVDKIIENYKRNHEESLELNEFWVNYIPLVTKYYDDYSNRFLSPAEYTELISTEAVKKAIARYYNFDNYIEFVLMPEE